jgi:hypothetical protein
MKLSARGLVGWIVAAACTAATANATQYAYVEISCNNYPEVDGQTGELLNAGRDGKVAPNCWYFSNVVTANFFPDPGAVGPAPAEARDEGDRIKQRAQDAFALRREACQRMTVDVRAGHKSLEDAESMRDKFKANRASHGDCTGSFQFFY